jgi:peptide/nickel transport system ATP-binding protein
MNDNPALNPTDLVKSRGSHVPGGRDRIGKDHPGHDCRGVLAQDRGTRTLEDRDMDEWLKKDARSIAQKIGVVYQNPAASISHRFTVFDAVAEPLTIHGLGMA